jgi:prophage regulatory protein
MKTTFNTVESGQPLINSDQAMSPEILALVERVRAVVNDRLLRLAQVKMKTGLAASTIWKFSKLGTLPPPLRVGRSACWKESEISAWIDANTFASRSKKSVDIKAFVALLTATTPLLIEKSKEKKELPCKNPSCSTGE